MKTAMHLYLLLTAYAFLVDRRAAQHFVADSLLHVAYLAVKSIFDPELFRSVFAVDAKGKSSLFSLEKKFEKKTKRSIYSSSRRSTRSTN